MSGSETESETGVITQIIQELLDEDLDMEILEVGQQKSPVTPQPAPLNMLLPFSDDGTAAYKPVTNATSPTYQAPSNGGGDGVEGFKETMSGSETELEMDLMTNATGEPLGVGILKSPGTTQPAPLNMLLPFSADGTAAYKPVTAGTSPSYKAPSNGEGGGVERIKETMSGSETELEMGLMTNTTGEPLGAGILKSPGTTQPAPLNMLLPLSADGTAAYKPVTAVTSPSYKAPSNGEGGGVEGIKETMSGSETELEMGLMTNTTGEPLGVGLLKSPGTTQQAPLNVLLPFSDDGAAADKPVTTAISTANQAPSNEGGGGVEGSTSGAAVSPHAIIANMNMKNKGSVSGTLEKKKRGRKRKYGPGGTLELALVAASQSVNQTTVGVSPSSPHPPPPAGAAAVTSPHAAAESISPTGSKKARVRPYASKKKQQHEGLGSARAGFRTHVINVKAGEDVTSKIMSFSLRGQRDICIMSANGTLSSVTLRELAISGGTTTYEGLFQILSLSGVFLPSENGDKRSRTGGLSVSLSGPDGRVLGGGVAGLLTAASPVQVLVASFKSDGRKEPSARL